MTDAAFRVNGCKPRIAAIGHRKDGLNWTMMPFAAIGGSGP